MRADRLKYEDLLQVRAPASLSTAIRIAATRKLTTSSEYVRQSVIDRLKADGVELSAAV
ncbi:hypothetical protein [Tardiphaga sp. vice352]|uniref:hypothetical protein n=1 Tax=Tardiphaga sp. vice352 TaxID=2592816 RepID=UPI00143DDA5E|nr:hypothetical protein [Tardiphaga sp. vice352]